MDRRLSFSPAAENFDSLWLLTLTRKAALICDVYEQSRVNRQINRELLGLPRFVDMGLCGL